MTRLSISQLSNIVFLCKLDSSCKADDGVYMTFNDVQWKNVRVPIDITDVNVNNPNDVH